jgi:hypothetical protein
VTVIASGISVYQNPDLYTHQIVPPAGSMTVRLIGVLNSDDSPVRASMPETNKIRLAHSPQEADTYQAWVVLTVTDPVTRAGYPVVPDWMVERYRSVLLDGVLARMMSHAAKPYSSPTMAAYHQRAFNSGMGTARIEADRQNTWGAQAWRFPQTFATNRR